MIYGISLMNQCIFCEIVGRRIPARIVFEDDEVVAFEDANPQAPIHTLIVPRKHLVSLKDVAAGDAPLLGHLLEVAAQLARDKGLESRGYRTVINTGSWAGQSVWHLHLHLLGGRAFGWPPG